MLALLYIVCTQKIKQKQVDVTVTDKCLECDKTFTGHFYVILFFFFDFVPTYTFTLVKYEPKTFEFKNM